MSITPTVITWKEPIKGEVDCALIVSRRAPTDSCAYTSPATPDDLRAACAAVGLVVDGGEFECAMHLMHAREALATEKARAEKAEGELVAVNGRLAGERDTVNHLRTKLAAAERERDEASALARCDNGEPWESECMRARKEAEDLRARLSVLTAPVDGEPTGEEMRRIWAEASCDAGHDNIRQVWRAGYAACAARQEKRIAEILHNVDAGLGINEAGPLVYALNARRDEAERAWEEERSELVRTRQETQDKLSEARKEMHERARHQPTEPRATEEELVRVYREALAAAGFVLRDPIIPAEKAAILALAARVRAERPACLVERAVKGMVDVNIAQYPQGWGVKVWTANAKASSPNSLPASDVRATLEAMLTEVGA